MVITLVAGNRLAAQNCEVKTEALQGSYEGDCKKSKADGKGHAHGIDTYDGEFKSGYPDGTGTYTWSNGDWYEGDWRKGMREGEGAMHYVTIKTADSLQKGFWKKDKYIGKYEKPYTVHSKSFRITTVTPKIADNSQNQIRFTIESITGGSSSINNIVAKPKITNIDVTGGIYINRVDQDNLLKTSVTTLQNVRFPFRARISIGTDLLDIEFLEEGNWNVEIKIQN